MMLLIYVWYCLVLFFFLCGIGLHQRHRGAGLRKGGLRENDPHIDRGVAALERHLRVQGHLGESRAVPLGPLSIW